MIKPLQCTLVAIFYRSALFFLRLVNAIWLLSVNVGILAVGMFFGYARIRCTQGKDKTFCLVRVSKTVNWRGFLNYNTNKYRSEYISSNVYNSWT